MSFAKYERPYAVRDAAGNIIYESAAFAQGIEEVVNGEASAAVNRGEAVRHDTVAGHSVFPRWDYSTAGTDVTFSTACKISALRAAASSDRCYLGVALETVPAGATVRIVVDGITAVNSKTGGVTSTTAGARIVGQAAGRVDTIAPNTVNTADSMPVHGATLGMMVVRSGTSSGQSGSADQIIARLNPC